MSEWISTKAKLPEETGVYLVTRLTQDLEDGEAPGVHWTVYGKEPEHDKYWDCHKNLYGQLPDGRYVTVCQRVWNEDTHCWSGFEEKVIAWQPMPEPAKEEDE